MDWRQVRLREVAIVCQACATRVLCHIDIKDLGHIPSEQAATENSPQVPSSQHPPLGLADPPSFRRMVNVSDFDSSNKRVS